MKITKISFFVLCLFLAVGVSDARMKRSVKVVGGTPIPGFGLVIDASYDPGLDNFVPGYRVLNVAIMNNSFNIIEMNPTKDEWWIKTRHGKKKYRAIGDLRSEEAKLWHELPENARSLIVYPLLLPIGARQVIDLFVPEGVPLNQFNSLIVKLASLNATFEVLSRQ